MREWLIQIRRERKMTQEYVAQEAGISQGYYAGIELGVRGHKIPVSTAKRIAEVLDFDWVKFYEEPSELVPRPERKANSKGKRGREK